MLTFAIALSLALWSAPATLDGAQQAQREFAGRLHEEGRYAEAAKQLETLMQDVGPRPELLFDAGQSRMAAGHAAHAWRHFQAYVSSPELTPEDRELGTTRLRAAEEGTTPVQVRLPEGTSASAVLARRVEDGPAARPPLDAVVVAGAASMRLDPGPWTISAEDSGAGLLPRRIEVGATEITVALAAAEPPAASPAPAVPTSAGPRRDPGRPYRITGAVLTPLGLAGVLGLAFVIPAYQRTGSAFTRLAAEMDTRPCTEADFAELSRLGREARGERGAIVALGVVSGALIGTGIGLLVHGTRRTKATKLGLRLQPALGGAFVVGHF